MNDLIKRVNHIKENLDEFVQPATILLYLAGEIEELLRVQDVNRIDIHERYFKNLKEIKEPVLGCFYTVHDKYARLDNYVGLVINTNPLTLLETISIYEPTLGYEGEIEIVIPKRGFTITSDIQSIINMYYETNIYDYILRMPSKGTEYVKDVEKIIKDAGLYLDEDDYD